jgi:hypothetical protein
VNQLQPRLDALLQNQLLSSLARNQLLLQQPLRPLDPLPLDPLQQAWRDSVLQQQLTNHSTLQPLLSRRTTTTDAESPAEASSLSSHYRHQHGSEETKKPQ